MGAILKNTIQKRIRFYGGRKKLLESILAEQSIHGPFLLNKNPMYYEFNNFVTSYNWDIHKEDLLIEMYKTRPTSVIKNRLHLSRHALEYRLQILGLRVTAGA